MVSNLFRYLMRTLKIKILLTCMTAWNYFFWRFSMTKRFSVWVFVVCLILLGSVDCFRFRKVYIGTNSGVDYYTEFNAATLFGDMRMTSIIDSVNMDDHLNLASVIDDIDILYLLPGNTPFDRSAEMGDLINQFVSDGGLLVYTSDINNIRAQDVTSWFQNDLFDIHSYKSPNIIDAYYIQPNKKTVFGSRYYGNYHTNYIAQATPNSVQTSFGRLVDNHWGAPFQRFVDNFYWIQPDTFHMALDEINEEYCMFKREGSYGGYLDTACWLFNFPHGQGHIVQIAVSLESPEVLYTNFIGRFKGIIEGIVGLQLEDTQFENHSQNVILRDKRVTQSYRSFSSNTDKWDNLLYDLSKTANVFLWDNLRQIEDFIELQNITNASALVANDLYFNAAYTKDINNLNFAYEDFIREGGNMVCNIVYIVSINN